MMLTKVEDVTPLPCVLWVQGDGGVGKHRLVYVEDQEENKHLYVEVHLCNDTMGYNSWRIVDICGNGGWEHALIEELLQERIKAICAATVKLQRPCAKGA